jgi:hypothetical protein
METGGWGRRGSVGEMALGNHLSSKGNHVYLNRFTFYYIISFFHSSSLTTRPHRRRRSAPSNCSSHPFLHRLPLVIDN